MSDVPLSSDPSKGDKPGRGAVDSSYELAPQEAAPDQATAEVVTPASERICLYCGFTVCGRTRGNRCPECSAPLDEHTAELLQFSPAAWIREISWGPIVLGLAVLVHLGGLISWPWWEGIRMGLDGILPKRPENVMAGSGMHVLAALLGFIGIWMLTAREPGAGRRAPPAGQVCRWMALAVLILWTGTWALGVKKSGEEFAMLNISLLATAGEAVLLGYFASGVASRIPHDGLTAQFRNMMVLLPPFVGFLLFCRFVDVTEYFKLFFLSLPLIFALMGLLIWVTVSFWRLTWELWAAAKASATAAQRRAARVAPRMA